MVKRAFALQLSSIIIGVIAILSFVTVYNLTESFNWVNHTHKVIYATTKIQDDVTDCQISVREAIFSDNKAFLNNYYQKSPGIEGQLDELQWLTRDNEVQQKNIYAIRQNIGRRLAAFRDQIELFNDGKIEEARTNLKQKFGEAWISSTRNISEIIKSEEYRLLDYRLRDYTTKSNLVMYGIPLLMIIYIVFFNATTKSLTASLDKVT